MDDDEEEDQNCSPTHQAAVMTGDHMTLTYQMIGARSHGSYELLLYLCFLNLHNAAQVWMI